MQALRIGGGGGGGAQRHAVTNQDGADKVERVCEEQDNERIAAAQFGFRKGLSTHHALKGIEERVSEALHEPSPGGFCAIIALDFKNAFNSASWKCIYQSLAEAKRMPQYRFRIMDSYLTDRKLRIVTEEGRIVTDLSAGVPQAALPVDLHV